MEHQVNKNLNFIEHYYKRFVDEGDLAHELNNPVHHTVPEVKAGKSRDHRVFHNQTVYNIDQGLQHNMNKLL